MSAPRTCKHAKMVSKIRYLSKPAGKTLKIGSPKRGHLMAKLNSLGKLACPECRVNWQEPGPANHSPIQDSCGHIKCRRCFIRNIIFNNNSCLQCYPEESSKDPLETDNGMPKLELMTTTSAQRTTWNEFLKTRRRPLRKRELQLPPPIMDKYLPLPDTVLNPKTQNCTTNIVGPASSRTSHDASNARLIGNKTARIICAESNAAEAVKEKTTELDTVEAIKGKTTEVIAESVAVKAVKTISAESNTVNSVKIIGTKSVVIKSVKTTRVASNAVKSIKTIRPKSNATAREKAPEKSLLTSHFKIAKPGNLGVSLRSSVRQASMKKQDPRIKEASEFGTKDDSDLGPTTCLICQESFGLTWAYDLHMKLHS